MSHDFFHSGWWEQTLFPARCESWVLLLLFLSDTISPSHAAMISTELNTWEGPSVDSQSFLSSLLLPMLAFLISVESQLHLFNSSVCKPLLGFPSPVPWPGTPLRWSAEESQGSPGLFLISWGYFTFLSWYQCLENLSFMYFVCLFKFSFSQDGKNAPVTLSRLEAEVQKAVLQLFYLHCFI